MTKTKQQLRAEAVERLSALDALEMYDLRDFAIAIMGDAYNGGCWNLRDALIDLLTDDCGPCYTCSRLAELCAENNALREIVGDLNVPKDPGEAAMMSVDAFIKKQTEHESLDSREKFMEQSEGNKESRWNDLFGTPERAARTFADFCNACDKGECHDCPLDKLTDFCIGYDDLLEWLRGDAE